MTSQGATDEGEAARRLGTPHDASDQGTRYDRMAEGYARWWAPVLVRDAVATLDLVDDDVASGAQRILDVGTGTGTLGLAAMIRWPRIEVVGIDASGEMAAQANREANRRLAPRDRARFSTRVATAEELPFDDASFDLAVSSFVLQLVPSRARALREICRVLRPGGRLAYVTWLVEDRPFIGDVVFDEVLDELGLGDEDDGGSDAGGGGGADVASPRAASDGLRRAGFVRARATAGVLEHRFDVDGYIGFLAEFDEEDLFGNLPNRKRARLIDRLRERFGALPPDDLTLRLPIVWATGVVPGDAPRSRRGQTAD